MIEVNLHNLADWPEAAQCFDQQLRDSEALLLPSHFWLVEGNNPYMAATAIADLVLADTVKYANCTGYDHYKLLRPLTAHDAPHRPGRPPTQVAYFGLAHVPPTGQIASNPLRSWNFASEVIGGVSERLGALFDSSLANPYDGLPMPPMP